MLRVLHLLATSRPGGTERFVADLAASTERGKFQHAIAVLESSGPMDDAYRSAAVVIHLSEKRFSWWQAVRRWIRAFRGFRPDVVVLYGARANLLGRLLPVRRRVPVIAALRSVTVDERNSHAALLIDRITFGRVDLCIANSAAAANKYAAAGFPSSRLIHVPGGIDLDRFRSLDRAAARAQYCLDTDDVVILCVANLKPVKNQAMLLEAFSGLRSPERGRLLLWLVGEGPDRAQLEQLADALGITDRVLFCGMEYMPTSRYAAADVFALASTFEGLPASVLEAMAAAKAIVAPAVGDIPALLNDGGGIVVPAPPRVDDLRGALQRLLDDPEQRSTLGRRAQLATRRYGKEASVRHYEELLERVARTGQQTGRSTA